MIQCDMGGASGWDLLNQSVAIVWRVNGGEKGNKKMKQFQSLEYCRDEVFLRRMQYESGHYVVAMVI